MKSQVFLFSNPHHQRFTELVVLIPFVLLFSLTELGELVCVCPTGFLVVLVFWRRVFEIAEELGWVWSHFFFNLTECQKI